MNKFLLIIIALSIFQSAYSQSYFIAGKIISQKDNSPIEYASVYLPQSELWAVTNNKGEFVVRNVPVGKVELTASCLGYAKVNAQLDVRSDITGFVLRLPEANLALEEVLITAQPKTDNLTTTYTINRAALEHAQVMNVMDITSLLPGGKTSVRSNNPAESDGRFALHSSGTSEKGNASFGTAIMVDGVRMQNNASFGETKGFDTRSLSATNIESIEVITGIPSVEYGDLSNGLVKINTKKGKTKWSVEMGTRPKSKQVALNKGFKLGDNGGVLNASAEYIKSVSDLASPRTSYDRNNLSLIYNKTFRIADDQSLAFTAGLAGNMGGYDSKGDPDAYPDTYVKRNDNTFRGHFKLNWLLNKSWITNMEFSGSASYADKQSKLNRIRESSVSQAAIHAKEPGYNIATDYDPNNPNAPIILTPIGRWYELSFNDSKPVNYNLKIKADWVHKWENLTNKFMLGSELDRSGNEGKGHYYDDLQKAPTWREYKYSDQSYVNNIAIYAEDKVTLPVGDLSTLQVVAGLRSDITSISGSDYGTAQSLSPRFNAKYSFWKNRKDRWVHTLNIHAGWGKAVKLPSFQVLYPTPSYSDQIAFTPGTTEENKAYYAYYTAPGQAIYNPDLKWQNTRQTEIGIEADIKGTKIAISAFRNKTVNPYMANRVYTPYSYSYTSQAAASSSPIPSADRIYSIDASGVVTVSDKTGANPAHQLAYTTRQDYLSNTIYTNGSSTERRGIDWSIEFAQIPSIRTSIRLDGNFYYYKGVEENIVSWKPSSAIGAAGGGPYQYIGYYAGTSSYLSSSDMTPSSTSSSSIGDPSQTISADPYNGSLSREINTNMTIVTHIPKIRLIVSLKIEGSFYNYTRRLSEYNGENWGFATSDPTDFFGDDTNIYGGDKYVVVYPVYYSTWDDPNTKIPFAEAFKNAKENNQTLYQDLQKLVQRTSTNYTFNPAKISSYFSANISVTKEIGDIASISFYANNFLNSLQQVKLSQSDTKVSLYGSNYIPRFNYGLSLRLKF